MTLRFINLSKTPDKVDMFLTLLYTIFLSDIFLQHVKMYTITYVNIVKYVLDSREPRFARPHLLLDGRFLSFGCVGVRVCFVCEGVIRVIRPVT